MPRADAFGFLWNDTPVEKPVRVKGERVPRQPKAPPGPRPIPEFPTNWRPKEFPRLEKAVRIALDTETKDVDLEDKGPGVRRPGNHIIGISCATDDGHSWYFPMRHEIGGEMNLPPENVIAWAKDNLTRPNQTKVGINLLYDLDYLAQEGVEVAGPFIDVGIAEALLDENAHGYSLEEISQRHLGVGKATAAIEGWIASAYGNTRNFRKDLYRSPPSLVAAYAEVDASHPLRILDSQVPRLRAEGLERLFEVECGLTSPLLAMRRRGVRVNMKRAQKIEGDLEISIRRDQDKLNALAGFEVNVDGKEHLVKIFDGLGLTYPRTPPSKNYPNGQPSFVKEFLEHHPHEVPQLITGIRRWTKFRDVFIRSYIYDLQINGRLHCLFNQVKTDDFGTVSGRFSSSLPNLQNIPIRDEIWGPLIRSIFIPDVGHGWAKLDWSQIEYRILVHLAYLYLRGEYGSDIARNRYRSDPTTDYHNFVAEITKVQRKQAKNINFGFVYGMGAAKLAHDLGLTLEEAEPIFQQYHGSLPFVQEIRKLVSAKAGEQGFVTTILGRRRRFDLWQPRFGGDDGEDIKGLQMAAALSKWGPRIRRAYTHKALNGEIQGSAADLMKLAMYKLWQRQDLWSVLGAPLLTVHDELDFSEPKTKIAKQAIIEVKQLMESTFEFEVPVIAELSRGINWGAAK